ncbi:hypothetical protein [Nocardioides sp. CFH 31398]|uniref:hypothetical protein n=1 Tax=Nocardioides sp. CFH 31398 TaxID=2919579 RepID=UPI001F05FE7A|nr:hypothetical protein [Nocardioides sp. CFH 31398]MCH1867959.1 hypothetical protein [Nocardioides sp. CFH 31398]
MATTIMPDEATRWIRWCLVGGCGGVVLLWVVLAVADGPMVVVASLLMLPATAAALVGLVAVGVRLGLAAYGER